MGLARPAIARMLGAFAALVLAVAIGVPLAYWHRVGGVREPAAPGGLAPGHPRAGRPPARRCRGTTARARPRARHARQQDRVCRQPGVPLHRPGPASSARLQRSPGEHEDLPRRQGGLRPGTDARPGSARHAGRVDTAAARDHHGHAGGGRAVAEVVRRVNPSPSAWDHSDTSTLAVALSGCTAGTTAVDLMRTRATRPPEALARRAFQLRRSSCGFRSGATFVSRAADCYPGPRWEPSELRASASLAARPSSGRWYRAGARQSYGSSRAPTPPMPLPLALPASFR